MQKKTWGILALAVLVWAVVAFDQGPQQVGRWEYMQLITETSRSTREPALAMAVDGEYFNFGISVIHEGLWIAASETAHVFLHCPVM